MKTIIFIALQLSQPRCIKRIESFVNAGFDVKVYGFDSGLYNESLKDLSFPVERIIKRDKSQNRIKKFISFFSNIRTILNENTDNIVYYLFGYEIASIAWLLRCKEYIYEEADVTASRVNNPIIRKLMIWIDKHIIKKSKLTIFTSHGFSDYLFGNKTPNNIILQLNKLNKYFDEEKKLTVKSKNFDSQHIKFGFVGLIRYPNTIIRFAKVVGKYYPQHEFHFFGDVEKPSFIDDEIKSYKNVFFHGRFQNPIDLLSIYSQIDINVVCYDTKSSNVRIAEPNKLYESIFFETPIVVSSGTFLAKRVEELNAGYVIDCSSDKSICDFINNIDRREIQNIQNQMHQIPICELVDNSDELVARCKSLVN